MLDFDLEKVPEEMKEASRKLHAAIRRERKARAQFLAWQVEHTSAEECRMAEEKSYSAVSMRWDPQTQTMSPALEDATKPS